MLMLQFSFLLLQLLLHLLPRLHSRRRRGWCAGALLRALRPFPGSWSGRRGARGEGEKEKRRASKKKIKRRSDDETVFIFSSFFLVAFAPLVGAQALLSKTYLKHSARPP